MNQAQRNIRNNPSIATDVCLSVFRGVSSLRGSASEADVAECLRNAGLIRDVQRGRGHDFVTMCANNEPFFHFLPSTLAVYAGKILSRGGFRVTIRDIDREEQTRAEADLHLVARSKGNAADFLHAVIANRFGTIEVGNCDEQLQCISAISRAYPTMPIAIEAFDEDQRVELVGAIAEMMDEPVGCWSESPTPHRMIYLRSSAHMAKLERHILLASDVDRLKRTRRQGNQRWCLTNAERIYGFRFYPARPATRSWDLHTEVIAGPIIFSMAST